MTTLGTALFALAALGLLVLVAQHLALRAHCAPRRRARDVDGSQAGPGVSILKPLCGIDDRLEENLAAFAWLDYRDYEVVLGLRDTSDPACALALRTVRRWPRASERAWRCCAQARRSCGSPAASTGR